MSSVHLQLNGLGLPLVAAKDPDTVPFRYRREIIRMMKAYVNAEQHTHLYIRGPAVSGKTWVASRIALELLVNIGILKEQLIYTTLMDMVSNVLDSSIPVSRYYSVGYLFIDNINTEKNAYSPSLLSRVVRHRIDYMKPVILVSSLEDEDFDKLYGNEMQERIGYFPCIELEQDTAVMDDRKSKRGEIFAEDHDA